MESKCIAVVGAGVNGVSIATASAAMGHSVTLYDARMPFAETSNASSRMLHGGIRYLEQGHIGLVREALLERDEWQQFSPDATRVERFYFPVFADSPRGKWVLFAGTLLYQWLAGRFSVGRSQLHSASDIQATFPNLVSNGLQGGASYCDVVMEYELLAQQLVSEAIDKGVTLKNETSVQKISTDGEVLVNDGSVKFDRVVNATGPWAARLLEHSGIESEYTIEHVRGSHLILNYSLDHALVLQAPDDRRIIFVIPLNAKQVLLGTTEEKHDLTKPIVCSDAETRYLLAILNRYLRDPIDTSAIESTFSGVRPIVRKRKDTLGDVSAASRDSEIEVYDRLVNVFGGKWTSARHLGNEVAKLL